MSDKRFRQIILDEIAELEKLSYDSSSDRAPVTLDQQAVGRLSRMDAMQQQSMELAKEDRRRLRIASLKSAIRRLDEGSFGECLSCGEDIAARRLLIDVAATLCIGCKQ